MLGGAGAGDPTGSSLNSTYIAGGLGFDTITLMPPMQRPTPSAS